MGIEVLEDIIDFEIRPIIKAINVFPFAQTIACCSGWTGKDGGISDGVNRTWEGMPYISIESLDDVEMLKFIKYISSKMIFDYGYINADALESSYVSDLSKASISSDDRQLIHFILEYRKEKLLFMLFIYEFDRTPEFIEKIWSLLNIVISEYKSSQETKTP